MCKLSAYFIFFIFLWFNVDLSNVVIKSYEHFSNSNEHVCVDLSGKWVAIESNSLGTHSTSDFQRIESDEVFPIFYDKYRQVQWKPSNSLPKCRLLRHFNRTSLQRCLISRNSGVMMSGDSTMRELWEQIASGLLEFPNIDTVTTPQHHCDAQLGYGCFSCLNGCKSKDFAINPFTNTHWMDWEVPLSFDIDSKHDYSSTLPPHGPRISFTWKPDFFSIEEITRFETATALEHVQWDAIVFNKGAHLAKELVELSSNTYDEYNTWESLVTVQSQQLADFIKKTFGSKKSTLLFWRESYYNHKELRVEEQLILQRRITRKIFEEAGFIILPGYDITGPESNVMRGVDGIHQHESVRSLIVDMILSHLC
jgi:hypothetical protein